MHVDTYNPCRDFIYDNKFVLLYTPSNSEIAIRLKFFEEIVSTDVFENVTNGSIK